MATKPARQTTLTAEEQELLGDALHSLEQTLLCIGEDQEPTHVKRERCPSCAGALAIELCPAERRFSEGRAVVRRGKDR